MAGNKEGGLKAAETNRQKHGEDFYSKLGRLGGKVTGTKKGFAANPALAKVAGRKGGRTSRRKAKNETKELKTA